MEFDDHRDAAAADRNLTIARYLLENRLDRLGSPAYEWVVIVSFYSAVRCINAWIQLKHDRPPVNHGERFRAILNDPALQELLEQDSLLRSWSEQARYTSPASAFSFDHASMALQFAQSIRDHVRSTDESV